MEAKYSQNPWHAFAFSNISAQLLAYNSIRKISILFILMESKKKIRLAQNCDIEKALKIISHIL